MLLFPWLGHIGPLVAVFIHHIYEILSNSVMRCLQLGLTNSKVIDKIVVLIPILRLDD